MSDPNGIAGPDICFIGGAIDVPQESAEGMLAKLMEGKSL